MNKKYLYGLVGLVVLVLIAWAIVRQPGSNGEPAKKQAFRETIEVSLTPEQKTALEQKISDTQGKLEASKTQNVPQQEIYSLYIDLGLNSYALGNLKAAKEAYLQAMDIAPNHPGVWVAIYPVYRDMYDYDNARAAIKKAVSLNPRDWNTWRNYLELEQYQFHATTEQLEKLYQEALEKTNYDINVLTVYAKFLEEQKGDLRSALNNWKIALQQQPNNQLFKDEIKRLEALIAESDRNSIEIK